MSSSDTGSEDEQTADHHVTGGNADPRVLQYFWDLASLQQEERESAASELVEALVSSQQQHDTLHKQVDLQPGGNLEQQEGGNRQQRMEQSLNCCSPLMAYGLKRLARGLASSRQGARQGFAAAFAATLAHSAAAAAHQVATPLQQPFVSAAGVVSVLEACLEVTGSMSGSDQRDALLGRVFGLAALTRSGLVTAYPAAGVDGGSMRAVALVATQLVGLLQRKSFLRESAAAALVELLQGLSAQQIEQVLSQAPKLSVLLQTPPASATPELLFITLRLWHNMPNQQLQHCQLLPALPAAAAPPPQQFWQQPSAVERSAVAAAASAVFSVQHMQLLVPCLLATSGSHPRLHPVWGCLLALLVPGFVPVKVLQQAEDQRDQQQQQRRAAPNQQQLSNLWQHFVDSACFSSSHERKALALQLLQLLLPVMTPDSVPVLLSKQLLGCLGTALRNKDSYLHVSAKKCMDRLSTCAEHSLVIRDDPVQAAKLRLALAAALQGANLGPATSSSKGGKTQLLSGMDAAGIAVYVDQLLQQFVVAVSTAVAAANGRDASESSEDEQMDDAPAGDSNVKQLLDQLAAALRLTAADTTTMHKGLNFLTAAAFLRLPTTVDTSVLSAAVTAAATGPADAPAAVATGQKNKRSKGAKGDKTAAAAQETEECKVVRQALQLAARMQPPPPQQIRQQCAARLVTLLHSGQHRPGQQSKKQQQQQQNGLENGVQVGGSKKQKKAQQQAQQEQAAAAARAAAAQQQEALTAQLLKLVDAAQQLPEVEPVADEDVVEMVQQLQQLEAAVKQHTKEQQQQQQQPMAGGAGSVRSRACIQLVQQLQLQLLAGGLSAEAAGSVVDDLEVAVVRGLGMSTKGLGSDRSAAGLSSDGDSDTDPEESDDDDEDEPAWQDVLLDLLLALLSSSSDAAAAKTGGMLIPTAPLREACEAVFRAFAEDITAQGLSDMMRVLSQRASKILKPRDDEADEMEVDQSGSGAGDDSSDDDVASDDERLADVAQQAAADSESEEGDVEGHKEDSGHLDHPGANKPQGPAAAAAAEDGDADDGNVGSDLDDDAMLAMDAQLGAAVRGMLERGGGGAKERAAALLGHQLRVAALMEEWIKKCSRSPLVAQITLPLLQALITARGAGGNPTLADRLTSLVNKHLSRCRPTLPAAATAAAAVEGEVADQQKQQWGLQSYEADMRKVLYYASREKDPRVAAAAAQALLVLLAAGAEAGGAAAAAAQTTAAAAFSDFFEKKKTRLQKQWCEQVLARCPEAAVSGAAGALTALLTACSKGRNEPTRSKAVQLLPVLFRSSQPQQQQAVLAALQQHPALLAAALGAAVAGPYKGKEQHAAAVKAVIQLLGCVQKLGDGKRLAELLGGETVRELGKVVVVVKAAGVPPRVESMLERLVESAGLQQLVAANKPDPARLALLKKAIAALEGKGGAAAAGHGQQQQEGKDTDTGDKQQQTRKKERKHKPPPGKAAAAALDKGADVMDKKQQRQQKQGGGKRRKGEGEVKSQKRHKQR